MKPASLTAGMLLACAHVGAIGIKPVPPSVPAPRGLGSRAGEWRGSGPEGDFDWRQRQKVKGGKFEQLIDHANPSLGTFTQRYWWSAENWAGPGSPVVVFTAGEVDASNYTGYATNLTLTGLIAKAVGGAAVVLEHRYFGQSSPVTVLSTANMTYLTLANAIRDHTYFAREVRLPFDPNRTSTPDKAPWILSGGSYGGALSGWISRLDPGTFWAYHASSGPVETVSALWHYFDPIREGAMPKNCSSDVVRVIEHVDRVLGSTNQTQKRALKDKFGMGPLADDDFASALTIGVTSWQSMEFFDYIEWPDLNFTIFCDYVEGMWNGSGNALPGPDGVGLDKALDNYAKWTNDFLVKRNWCQEMFTYDDFAGPNNVACLDYHNASSPLFTDLALNNTVSRQWYWFLCNEAFEWWQVAPPRAGTPSIVSSLVDVDYSRAPCALLFPPGPNGETYGLAKGRSAETVDAYTGGWDGYWANTTRLVWTNGELDPWRAGSVSSDQRPAGPLRSSAHVPVNLIPGGIHCSDLVTGNRRNPAVKKVMDAEIAVIKGWVDDFYKLRQPVVT